MIERIDFNIFSTFFLIPIIPDLWGFVDSIYSITFPKKLELFSKKVWTSSLFCGMLLC